jgi:hypothetical protein
MLLHVRPFGLLEVLLAPPGGEGAGLLRLAVDPIRSAPQDKRYQRWLGRPFVVAWCSNKNERGAQDSSLQDNAKSQASRGPKNERASPARWPVRAMRSQKRRRTIFQLEYKPVPNIQELFVQGKQRQFGLLQKEVIYMYQEDEKCV